jgi:hypothetical protein
MPPTETQKTKGERVREAITLLKKLQEVGIHSEDLGYKATKNALDKWISDGSEMTEKIEFMRYGRVGHLTLPYHSGNTPTFVLKATEQLKEQLADGNDT